jgi:hypothetical protein
VLREEGHHTVIKRRRIALISEHIAFTLGYGEAALLGDEAYQVKV